MFQGKARGILHILGAALSFSLMTLMVRMAGDLPTMQKVFFRNAVAAVYAVIVLARSEQKFYIRKDSHFGLFMRASFGAAGMVANFWAIDHLAVADANMLNKMSPFFAILMSVFILAEIPSKIEILSVVVAMIGAMFIVKPTMGIASIPALVGLFGGFGAGTAYTFVRKLGKQGERGPVIVMYFSVFTTLLTLPFFIATYHPMSLKQWLCLIGAGTFAAAGQFNITAAYTYAPAKEISVYDYTQVLFAALWGILFFGETPDMLSLIGYGLIIGTAVVKWRISMRADKDPGELKL